MNIQYLSDATGKTTGVFIPIAEWNDLKEKYKEIEQDGADIPEWHKMVVTERLEAYKKDPSTATEFDAAMDDIESSI